MTIESITAVGHVGICVSDRERSLKFYCEGLGFEVVQSTSVQGPRMSRLIGLEEVEMTMTIIRRDTVMLELLHPESPSHVGAAEPPPLNQLGFTHLALWVDDVDAAAQGVVDHGGRVLEDRRAEFDQAELRARFQMCTDPDGVRIELIEYPAGQAEVVGP